jgi:CMP-N-acetylneuraminic acid synthetase
LSDSMKIIALLPMRHHSERVPGKNYRAFAGVPLYQHILRTLLTCNAVAQVVIDTDSPVISEEAARLFPDVRLIERPQHLRDGKTPTNDILLHDISLLDGDCFLQTHCTNPLLRPETVARAVEAFFSNYPSFDSLFSVTRLQTRLWNQDGKPVNHDPDVLLRTQDLPPVYEENSNLYIFTRQTLEKRRNRLGNRPLMFEIDRLEAWDIDEELDFIVAEFLYLQREKTGG